MKKVIKKFLTENFDLNINHVRVGVIKYGKTIEVPIALGDYNNSNHLLLRLDKISRIKGNANLNKALYKAAEELYLSSVNNELLPHIVIIWKNGDFRFFI